MPSRLLLFMLSAAVCALPCAASAVEAAKRPNIVLILTDDLGYGDPGCFNPQSKIRTPQIDRLAREGMKFTDAHAPASVCHPSRYGLLTGRYPFRTDTSVWPKKPVIEAAETTLPGLLKAAGYRTAMVGKWHLGFQENGNDRPLPGGPVDRGFETFFGIRASTDIPPYFYIRDRNAVAPPSVKLAASNTPGWSPIQGEFWREGLIAPGMKLADVLPKFTDEAVSVIENHAKTSPERPLFLYFAPPSPHTPWLPSGEFAGRGGAGMYGEFVTMTDAMIGRVLKALDDAKMTDNTLVIFTSDNGPTWYPADVERFGHAAAGGLRGMKGDAFEGGHRLPFVVRHPGRVAAGTTTTETICFTDVLATCAELVGTPLPPDAGPDSFSFLPTLVGQPAADRPVRPALVIATGLMAIRRGPWKYIDGIGSGGFTKPSKIVPGPGEPTAQLYDLATDPAETNNLFAARPALAAELKAELERIRQAGRSRP